MGRKSGAPHYSLSLAQELVAAERFRITLRVANALNNHYGPGEANRVVKTVFAQLSQEDYHKSIPLEKVPGRIADVYIGGWFDDAEWYVKFFIVESNAMVQIFSLKEDGCNW